jgi:hypothetical protein
MKLQTIVRKVWRLIPVDLRDLFSRVRFALSNAPLIQNPTYADDGLISQHITEFLNDKKFIDSYNLGKKTGALKNHPGDIHFRAYIACWAAKYALALPGDFVECGVGKGLLSKTIVNYLGFEKIEKKLYLFDTFLGIPVEQGVANEKKNMEILNKTHFSIPYFEDVGKAFSEYPNVILVKGIVPDTFREIDLGRVAYISIDMNNASAEISAIEYLWDKLVFGGVVVLDDYAYGPEFLEQKRAWDIFALNNKIEILTLPTGQGLIIKNINN